MMMHPCSDCKELKPRSEFYGNEKRSGTCKPCSRDRSKAYYEANKAKAYEVHRQWVADNPERVKAHKAKSAYGIDYDEYFEMMARPCAICGSGDDLRIDHNHDTNEVRGTLCDRCNKGLGFFRDNAELLEIAMQYLKPDIFEATYDKEET